MTIIKKTKTSPSPAKDEKDWKSGRDQEHKMKNPQEEQERFAKGQPHRDERNH